MTKASLILATVFVLTALTAKSQPIIKPGIEFEYDNVGNRKKRLFNPNSVVNRNGETLGLESPPDTLNKTLIIKAYPNPTDGNITVENLSTIQPEDCFIKIYDITGRLLLTRKVNDNKTGLNISDFTPGSYMMLYYSKNQLKANWTIIKR